MNKIVNIDEVEIGMVIDKPIYRENGALLVPEQTIVTNRLKYLLIEYGVSKVTVRNSNQLELDTSTESIRKTITFKIFNEEMIRATENIKQQLLQLTVDGALVNLDKLSNSILNLLNISENNIQLMDMIYCMRNYDDETYIHSVNVAMMCKIMGEWIELHTEDRKVLLLCGLLHDIGKLEIPKEILTKTGYLTQEEMEIIKCHPGMGYTTIKDLNIDDRVKMAVYEHHEKCDGTGYPEGLKGSQIGDFSKIVTIIDIYDAMTADRAYRKGICPFKVIQILSDEGYEKYDPKYLMIFLQRISETYINKYVHLSTGETGKIIMINNNDLSRPLVKVEDRYIDLSKCREISIEVVL